MLISPQQSLLLVVDIQDKLVPAVVEPQQLIEKTRWLLEVAQILEVPVLASEQYPQGLGHTVTELSELIPAKQVVDKLHFSCAAEPACLERIAAEQRKQIVICGMEAHVCVFQTAAGLHQAGYEVFVIGDLISSRSASDHQLALERMRQLGIQVVSREMVAFEWMQKSGTDSFRTISKNYLR
ncbi:hydrolase [Motiliproteus sp.]|uniref:hydrolase n=1 Tax=Motiliproteus sp. TaxID=1898955 RepID=UPI003BAA3264